MSIGSFTHSVEQGVVNAEQHVVHFFESGEAATVVAEVESVALKFETFLGSNQVLATYAKPLVDKLEAGVVALGKDAVTSLASGTSLGDIVTKVEAGIPTLVSQTKTDAIGEIKAASPGAHTSFIIGLIDILYSTVAPRLPQLLAGLVGTAGQ